MVNRKDLESLFSHGPAKTARTCEELHEDRLAGLRYLSIQIVHESVVALIVWPLCAALETLMDTKLALVLFLLVAQAPLVLEASPPIAALALTPLWNFAPLNSGGG